MSDPFRERLNRLATSAGDPAPDREAIAGAGRRHRAMRVAGVVLTASILVAAIVLPLSNLGELGGGAPSPAGSTSGPAPTTTAGLVRGSGTVLQAEGDEAAGLCLGGVLESLPPQCDGIPIEGWDWDAVDGEESAGGTTWGGYEVIGSYDGTTFTLAEVVGPQSDAGGDVDFTAPCDEPDGGWIDVDPARASDDDFNAAMHAAEAEPDSTAVWIDYVVEPVGEDTGPFIGVFGFTGDLERHEADLRELWGGPMCVFQQATPFRELRRIQDDLGNGGAAELGLEMTFSSVDVLTNRVEVGAIVTSPQLEAAIADRYGEGKVTVVPALTPV